MPVSDVPGPSLNDAPTVLWVVPTPRGLAECWALDAYTRPPDGRTRVAELFTKAKYQRLGPPLMVLRRMFAEGAVSISRFRSWPPDVVVVPVASSSELPMELARAAAAALEVPLLRLFRQPSGPKMKNVPIAARDAGVEGRAAVDLRARSATPGSEQRVLHLRLVPLRSDRQHIPDVADRCAAEAN